MKARFTSLDVRAMVLSLQQTLLGYRVANVYDLNAKTYLLKLAKPDSKAVLLLESGIRLHTTVFERDKGNVPSGFTIKLRKCAWLQASLFAFCTHAPTHAERAQKKAISPSPCSSQKSCVRAQAAQGQAHRVHRAARLGPRHRAQVWHW